MSYQSVVLADSPAAFWLLNETSGTAATDLTNSNGTPGVYTGTYSLNQTPLAAGLGGSLGLTGSGYVSVTDTTFINTTGTSFSMECWFSTTSTASIFYLIEKGNGGANQDDYYMWWNTTGNIFAGWYNGAFRDHVLSWTPTTNTTYHIVVVFDGTHCTLYINGSQQAQVLQSATAPPNGTLNMRIGESGNSTFGLNGSIAAPAIYLTNLNSTQIGNHYTAGTTATVVNITPATIPIWV